ncbi:unnamed protein product [Vitrella brassicaformis CCMP3155]|uniref:Phytocyanin domain-containing protein n=2 Tax=Vitrella brassicaformis TaxID=1169539 RepID=A0A0G4FZK1_VITBC|nr:unnamed protein product [Vitrella brassicaformis CCMP3155]|eukprot:CEM20958.1 unnamed protein product [Vitrella brassicaformis CCMP3155]
MSVLSLLICLVCLVAPSLAQVGSPIGVTPAEASRFIWTVAPYEDMEISLGQSLSFRYPAFHDVALADDEEAYTSCAKDKMTVTGAIDKGMPEPFVFTPEEVGTYYIVCSVADHCELGQRFVLNVTEASPQADTEPIQVLVAQQPTWAVGVKYDDITARQDTVLNFVSNIHHDVVLINNREAFENCTIGEGNITVEYSAQDFANNPVFNWTVGPCKEYYLACSIGNQGCQAGGHCGGGQKLKVIVEDGTDDCYPQSNPEAAAVCFGGEPLSLEDSSTDEIATEATEAPADGVQAESEGTAAMSSVEADEGEATSGAFAAAPTFVTIIVGAVAFLTLTSI